jgi:L-lactate dehydrogenase
MALAYTLALKGVVRELVLVGSNRDRARGEAMDLNHAHAFLRVPLEVRAGGLEDVHDSEVVAICASVSMKPGLFNRNDLAAGNAALMRTLLPTIAKVAPVAKIVMLSNPVDVMTWQALKLTGFPAKRVVGIGTLVDSARFRDALSNELAIHPDDLRSYVLGEHGDTQFPAMSLAQAGGEPIADTQRRRELFARTVGSGLEVFKLKGHTCYAVAAAAAATIESILLDEKRTLPLSIEINEMYGVSGVCLSLPVVVGAGGVEQVLHPPLDESEQEAFQRSAVAVRKVIEWSGALEG